MTISRSSLSIKVIGSRSSHGRCSFCYLDISSIWYDLSEVSVINKVKVMQRSDCKCLIFYWQAGGGPSTERHSCLYTVDDSKDGSSKPGGRKNHTKKNITKTKERAKNPVTFHGKGPDHGELVPLIRNAHAVTLHGLRLSDYVWLCQLDEAKGLKIRMEYKKKKSATTFIHYIAQSEREKVR